MRCLNPKSSLIVAAVTVATSGRAVLYEVSLSSTGIAGLNNAGQVVYFNDAGQRVIRTGNSVVILPTDTGSSAFPIAGSAGLSESGYVLGYGRAAPGSPLRRAAIWSPTTGWQVMPNGPSRSVAVGMTGTGRVLVAGGQDASLSQPGWWMPGSPPVDTGLVAQTFGCDAAGDAVFLDPNIHGFIIRASGARVNLMMGSNFGAGYAMEAGGLVAGLVYPGGSNTVTQTYGAVWASDGSLVRNLPVTNNGWFNDINGSGVAIGYDQVGSSVKAVIWNSDNSVQTLDSLLTPTYAGYQMLYGNYINNSGVIACTGYAPGSTTLRDFLLTPVPEPGSFAVLGLGVGILLRRRRC